MALNKKKKEVKKSQYYVWFIGTKEARGLRGEEFIRPVVNQFLEENNDDISKVTLQLSEKGMKIVQVVQKKANRSKSETIKYFIPDHCITCAYQSPPPHDDIVSCILLIYNPETECPVHVHSYRTDSVETASLLFTHLQQLINKPENQQKFEILEKKLIGQGLLPSTKMMMEADQRSAGGTSPESSDSMHEQESKVTPSAYPTRDHVYMPNNKMTTLMEQLTNELSDKLKSRQPQPILLPPKDYDTITRRHGDVHNSENRKSLQVNIVGPNAVHVTEEQETVDTVPAISGRYFHERQQSSGLGSSLPESPPRQRAVDNKWRYNTTNSERTSDKHDNEHDSGHHSDDDYPFMADDGFMYVKPPGRQQSPDEQNPGVLVRPYSKREPSSPSKSIDSGIARNSNSFREHDSKRDKWNFSEREPEQKGSLVRSPQLKTSEQSTKDDFGIVRVADVNQPRDFNASDRSRVDRSRRHEVEPESNRQMYNNNDRFDDHKRTHQAPERQRSFSRPQAQNPNDYRVEYNDYGNSPRLTKSSYHAGYSGRHEPDISPANDPPRRVPDTRRYDSTPALHIEPYESRISRPVQRQMSPKNAYEVSDATPMIYRPKHSSGGSHGSPSRRSYESPRLQRHPSDVSPLLQRHRNAEWTKSSPNVYPGREEPMRSPYRGSPRMPVVDEDFPDMPPVGYTNPEFDRVVERKRQQRQRGYERNERYYEPASHPPLRYRHSSPPTYPNRAIPSPSSANQLPWRSNSPPPRHSPRQSAHPPSPMQNPDPSSVYQQYPPPHNRSPVHREPSSPRIMPPSPHSKQPIPPSPSSHYQSNSPGGIIPDMPKNYQGMYRREELPPPMYSPQLIEPERQRPHREVRRAKSFQMAARPPIAVYQRR